MLSQAQIADRNRRLQDTGVQLQSDGQQHYGQLRPGPGGIYQPGPIEEPRPTPDGTYGTADDARRAGAYHEAPPGGAARHEPQQNAHPHERPAPGTYGSLPVRPSAPSPDTYAGSPPPAPSTPSPDTYDELPPPAPSTPSPDYGRLPAEGGAREQGRSHYQLARRFGSAETVAPDQDEAVTEPESGEEPATPESGEEPATPESGEETGGER